MVGSGEARRSASLSLGFFDELSVIFTTLQGENSYNALSSRARKRSGHALAQNLSVLEGSKIAEPFQRGEHGWLVEARQRPQDAVNSNPNMSWTEPATGMEFVWVPAGCFQMGCGPWTSDCQDHEKPQHEVCVSGFWMGQYEVTQSQWEMIMGHNPSRFKGSNNPVENVSWNMAKDFVARLNGRGPVGGFSLPTEAQWEYACRAGGRREKYCGGDDVDRVAWYSNNSAGRIQPVGTRSPNALGLFDMSGNVWEWVEDVYDKEAYSRHSRNNPLITSGSKYRVLRGGSWYVSPWFVRSTGRNKNSPDDRISMFGFRLVRMP